MTADDSGLGVAGHSDGVDFSGSHAGFTTALQANASTAHFNVAIPCARGAGWTALGDMHLLASAPRKITFARHWRPSHHRSGWGYAMDALKGLQGERGVFLDGFIEKKFAWGFDPGDRNNCPRPYDVPWIGFVHNPPDVPPWFNLHHQAPEDIIRTTAWRESLWCCQGLFTLSAHLKQWLERRVPVPVSSLVLPSETPPIRVSARKYRANGQRHLVHVGWWLRRFASFYQLKLRTVSKVLLSLGDPWTEEMHRLSVRRWSTQTRFHRCASCPTCPIATTMSCSRKTSCSSISTTAVPITRLSIASSAPRPCWSIRCPLSLNIWDRNTLCTSRRWRTRRRKPRTRRRSSPRTITSSPIRFASASRVSTSCGRSSSPSLRQPADPGAQSPRDLESMVRA
jgi:hypothetical protein